MNDRARKYLDTYAQHPHLIRRQVEVMLGYGKGFAERWAKVDEEFGEEERRIRSRWQLAERRRRAAGRAIEENAPMPGGPAQLAEEEPLAPELARFLEVFAEEKGHRTNAIARCQAEGFRIEWEDVERALRDRRFSTRFHQIFERALVLVEDEQVKKGQKGGVQSALAVLKAHKPALYGNQLKVTVSGGIQLTAGDRGLVEAAKAGPIRRFRERSARSAEALVRSVKPVENDVIEGEYEES